MDTTIPGTVKATATGEGQKVVQDSDEDQSPPAIRGRDIALTLRLLSGREVQISISEDATMSELRRSIEKTLALPPHLTRLYLEEVQVTAGYDSNLAQAGIVEDSVLTIVTVASEDFHEVTMKGFGQQLLPSRLKKVKWTGSCAYWQNYTFRDILLGDKVSVRCVKNAFSDQEWAGCLVKEIFLLQHFQHENILRLLDAPPPQDGFADICIVVEHMDTDLESVLRSRQELTEEHFQYLTYQILRALSYVHSAGVVHRQMRPRSVLVNKDCHIKLTNLVDALPTTAVDCEDVETNRWYRSPELILNRDWATLPLSGACDAWAVGCILAEMYQRKPIMPSRDIIDHVLYCLKLLGIPSAEEMDWVTNPKAHQFIATASDHPRYTAGPADWAEQLGASEGASQLLRQLVVFDPRRRCTCQEALQQPYFQDWYDPEDRRMDRCPDPVDWSLLDSLNSPEKQRAYFREECQRRHPEIFESRT